MAEAIAKFIGAIIMAGAVMCGIVFLAAVGGAAFGALGGWVVGWFFNDTIALGMRAFHLEPMETWQLGCFLGFVGGFFKATLSTSSKKDD